MSGVGASSRWRTLTEVLGDRDLGRLFIGVGSWAATDAAFLLAVSVLALDLGGPGAVGLVGALRVLPAAVCAGLFSGVADRVSRPLIIAGVNAALVVVAVVAAVAAGRGAGLGTLLAVVATASAVSALLKPSQQALLPQLVTNPGQLMAAGSTWSTLNGLGSVVGPALAGLGLALWGPVAVFGGLAVAYLGTALATWSIRSPFQRARRTGGRVGWTERAVARLLGVSLFWRPGRRAVFLLLLVGRAMSGLVTVFVVLSARSLSGGSGQALTGTLFAALGVGGMVASVATLVAGGHRARLWL
ncbi:MAG: MFS transporter, partial [Ornithinibacter sp.]